MCPGPSGIPPQVGHRPLRYLTQESWWWAHTIPPPQTNGCPSLSPDDSCAPPPTASASVPSTSLPISGSRKNKHRRPWSGALPGTLSPTTSIYCPCAWYPLPPSQRRPASLRGTDYHPHFIGEEANTQVDPEGKAQPNLLAPEPSPPRAEKPPPHRGKCGGQKN